VKISAYIPCRNDAAYLPAAIQALRAQSCAVDELLVIDDGSTDESSAVAARLGARVLRHETPLGRGAARARAMMESSGDVVLGLDATCTIPPDFLERALSCATEDRVAGVCARPIGLPPQTAVERWRARHLFKEHARVATEGALITCASLLRREAVLSVGNFDPTLHAAEDRELGQRLRAQGWSIRNPQGLTVRLQRRDTLSSLLARYRRWNDLPGPISPLHYGRLVSYAIKVMAREDLRSRDWAAALISFCCPHAQFWASVAARCRPQKQTTS
jgi:glycosyltransferase involved in cell wall biosynthesis